MKWKIKFERYIEDTRISGHEETIEITIDVPYGFKPLGFSQVVENS